MDTRTLLMASAPVPAWLVPLAPDAKWVKKNPAQIAADINSIMNAIARDDGLGVLEVSSLLPLRGGF